MVAPAPFTSRLKAQLRLAINRLRLVQQKETAIAKQQRRFMAQLLEEGKEQSAKYRVENIIRQDMNVEVLEILELYCELLLARIGLLEAKDCDPGLEEAVKTIIYAAPRTEIKDLHVLKEMFVRKYDKEFVQDAVENSSKIVPEKVTKRLGVAPPDPELVNLYLGEIAKAYHVFYSGLPPEEDIVVESDVEGDEDDDDSNGGNGGQGLQEQLPDTTVDNITRQKARRVSGLDNLRNPDAEPASPISIITPSPSTDNPRPHLKVDVNALDAVEKPAAHATVAAPKIKPKTAPKSKAESELDELRKRFEALRQK